jgi:hypothetical protein
MEGDMRSLKLQAAVSEQRRRPPRYGLNDKKSFLDEASEEYRLFIGVGIVFPHTSQPRDSIWTFKTENRSLPPFPSL